MVDKIEEKTRQIKFAETELIDKIIATNEHFKGYKLVSAKAELNEQLEGFMSNILMVDFTTENSDGMQEEHHIIVKLMKGSAEFRTTSKSYTQFSNEVFIYNEVIRAYKKLLKDEGIPKTEIDPDKWVPILYFGDYDLYPSLSDTHESILALENVKNLGFRNGPRLELDREHIFLMTKTIAQYHSLTYAMRINKDPKLWELKKGIKPLPFNEPDGSQNIFNVIYRIALDRFFEYLDRSPEHQKPEQFHSDMEVLRQKFLKNPVDIMDHLLTDDRVWSVILHGDYNRNNVMFKYDNETGYENPTELRMIDFQEIRYGSPACDLSFYLYFNMTPELREEIWDEVLKYYHDNLIQSLATILHVPKFDHMLKAYSYENFINHISKFMFYGVMVAIHFLPWMMCPEDECNKLSGLFENDMLSKEFYEYAQIAGGDAPNLRMTLAAKHASEKGYTKFLHDY